MDIDVIPEVSNPEVQARIKDSLAVCDQFSGAPIKTDAEYQDACAHLVALKKALKKLEEERKSITRPIDESKKRVMTFFKGFTDRIQAAERDLKQVIGRYVDEQERKRREEALKAKKKAEAERRKLLEQAAKAREKEREQRAATLEERAQMVAPPPPPPPPPKPKGVSKRVVWRFDITDPAKVPDMYRMIDEKKIASVVKALKDQTDIPGVRVWPETVIVAGER